MPKPNLLRKVDLPVGQDGRWKISKFEVSSRDATLSAIGSFGSGRSVSPGTYTALHCGTTIVMSDTSDELRDLWPIANRANGHVLIAGLGLGCVLQAVLDHEDVTRATVIERSPEVIRLVGPTYKARYGDRLEIIEADIYTWKPPKDAHYGAAWMDVWNELCTDNLKKMTKLKRRFSRKCDWMGCWGEEFCRRRDRHDKKHERVWGLR